MRQQYLIDASGLFGNPLNIKRIRRDPKAAHDAIVGAAERLLDTADFAELTVDAVMREAGMTRSAFYHYFSGLDELALALLERFDQAVRDSLAPWRASDATLDHRAATRQALRAMFEVIENHRTQVGAVAQAASAYPRVYDAWQRRVLDHFFEQTAEFIKSQNLRGLSRVDDPDGVARALILMNNAVISDNLARPDPQSPDALARALGSIWNATLYGPPALTPIGDTP